MDGHNLPAPSTYMLLKILPPEGSRFWTGTPYMIIDPRAGHGAGIGGFKPIVKVGVALHDGHPFISWPFDAPRARPDARRRDARGSRFVKEIGRRHPKAAKPIIVGNWSREAGLRWCWRPQPRHLRTLVINGAPWPIGLVASEECDALQRRPAWWRPAGAFAGRDRHGSSTAPISCRILRCSILPQLFRQILDLFCLIRSPGRHRFLDSERWWGGFHFMNEAEDSLDRRRAFRGNRLSRGEARD